MSYKNIRYIVFFLNPDVPQYLNDGRKVDVHSGEIFCELKDAKKYAQKALRDKLCTRFAIGTFVMDMDARSMDIYMIETFGFRKDKKNINQLSIFS